MEQNEAIATLETSQIQAKPKLEHRVPFFTKENAKALAAKGREAKARKQAERDAEMAQLQAEAEMAKNIIVAKAIESKQAPALEPDETYRLEQLARTRTCLASLYSDFDRASDAKERKFLSDAIARLSDVEFALAKRPKPAAYRTAPEKPKRSQASTGPFED